MCHSIGTVVGSTKENHASSALIGLGAERRRRLVGIVTEVGHQIDLYGPVRGVMPT